MAHRSGGPATSERRQRLSAPVSRAAMSAVADLGDLPLPRA